MLCYFICYYIICYSFIFLLYIIAFMIFHLDPSCYTHTIFLGRGQTRTITKTVKNDSFFNFFDPPVGMLLLVGHFSL